MNIYEKLTHARCDLRSMELKKSGENAFAKYKYYELVDIIPPILEVCEKHKLCTHTTFSDGRAVLTVVNAEAPEEKLAFESPMFESEMKGATRIQALGAVETYQRRYLYITAFDIVEDDPNEKMGDSLSAHNALIIKKRIEQLITDKMAKGNGYAEISKAAGYKREGIDRLLHALTEISNMEKKIEKL